MMDTAITGQQPNIVLILRGFGLLDAVSLLNDLDTL